jgi:hypothetical protein
LELAVREQTLRIGLLGIDHADRTFYNLLEFSTAYSQGIKLRTSSMPHTLPGDSPGEAMLYATSTDAFSSGMPHQPSLCFVCDMSPLLQALDLPEKRGKGA